MWRCKGVAAHRGFDGGGTYTGSIGGVTEPESGIGSSFAALADCGARTSAMIATSNAATRMDDLRGERFPDLAYADCQKPEYSPPLRGAANQVHVEESDTSKNMRRGANA